MTLQVRYQISVGSTTYTPNDQSHLIELQAISTLQVPVNRCRLVIGHPEGVSVSPESPITVKLGYGDTTTVVFTGVVGSAEWGVEHVIIHAVGSFRALVLARLNLLYEKPNAGDIVKDVAQSRLKIKVDKIDNGLKFPVYALGDRTPAYDHLATLAQQCGFDFYASSQDKLVFAPYKAAKTHEVSYGNQILQLTLDQPAPGVTGVEIYGESPSSQGQGEQAYTWLTKKEVKGSAGSQSAMSLRLDDPTARTQALVDKIARATLEQRQQKQRGKLTVLGDPTLQMGDAIKINKMPLSQQNGTFKITGVTHRLNRQRGFYTLIDWEEI